MAEFTRYAHQEGLIPTELNSKCLNNLNNLRKNFLSLSAIENARKKEKKKSSRIDEEDIENFYHSKHCQKIQEYLETKPWKLINCENVFLAEKYD